MVEVGERVPERETAVDTSNGVDSSGFDTRLVMSAALLDTLVDQCEMVRYQGGGLYARLTLDLPARV